MERNHRKMQYQVFAATWIAYAGFYFCRKNFSVAMPFLAGEYKTSNFDFANIIAVYSLVYMLGQFINGYLTDKLGAKQIVTIGMLLSILANATFGFAHGVGIFIFFMVVNGLGQSTGWPGLVKIMSGWFLPATRGIVMSWWTTCYVVGGFLAVLFATWWASNAYIMPVLGWRRSFFAPALLLGVVTFIFMKYGRNSPEKRDSTIKASLKIAVSNVEFLQTIMQPAIWVAAISYFFIKFIRYTFLFWLPLYLSEAFLLKKDIAGYTSSIFEAAGFIGILLSGYLSDKLWQTRRFPVAAIFMLLLGGVFILYSTEIVSNYWGIAFAIALTGLFTYGPDAIISGAAAQDIGKNNAGIAAGFINGVGSAGQLLSPYAVAFITEKFGWNNLFYIFMLVSVASGLLLSTQWSFGKSR